MKVDIYFDIVCPWCYIGERRFMKALEMAGETALELTFRPFQLDPGAAPETRSLGTYLTTRFGAMAEPMQRRVSQYAEAEGIRIEWERALIANTERAHRLVRLATLEYDAGVQRALVEALFRFHFTEGGDLGDVEQLANVAQSAGMDRARALAWLTSTAGERDVRAALQDARSIGVQSVPTFVFDDQFGIEGAQSPETFVAALAEVRERTAAGAAGREA